MFPEARGVEFLIIAAIALIVVGPKELPGLLRKLGQFVAKMRNIANEFRASFDEMARQSELDDLRKQVEEMRAQANAAAAHPDPTGSDDMLRDIQASLDNPTTEFAPDPDLQPEPAPVAEAPKPQMTRRKAATSRKAPTAKVAMAETKAAASKAARSKSPSAKVGKPPSAKAPAKPRSRAKAEKAS